MRFKQLRFGPRLLEASRQPGFLDQVHVAIGGTGAVGGATVWQWISMFEQVLAHSDQADRAPRILVTARTKQEIRSFTRQLYRLQQRDHRADPEHVDGVGYRTVGGVLIDLRTFGIDPAIEGISGFAGKGDQEREQAVLAFLASAGLAPDAPPEQRAEALEQAVAEKVARPFSEFLQQVATELESTGGRAFRSVVVGIPMASVATYKLGDLDAAGPHLGIDGGSERMQRLKDAYIEAVVDDLAQVSDRLADEVLVAHTTAVGGMYDEEQDGQREIRLGFAHSAKGDLLREKQSFARKLTALYSARDIKMLITAAAIGVDAILRRERVPINGRIKTALTRARASDEGLIPEQQLNWVHSYAPKQVPLDSVEPTESTEPLVFTGGRTLLPEYMVRSGENGFFSVPNADALYRVMRVTSATELGLVLARTAVLGDDPSAPRFVDNIYYYTETDNSRQVFDLLADPPLLQDQLAGLTPKALQDLGSAKHQAELHTLGLLILLHRLRALDLDAIPRNSDSQAFQPAAYFESHSPRITIERAVQVPAPELAAQLRTLVTATEPRHLAPLLSRAPADEDRELVDLVLTEVLHAVWNVTSLGTPILVDGTDGAPIVLVGPFAAPLDLPLPHASSLGQAIQADFQRSGADLNDPQALHLFQEFLIAGNGFCDLRDGATLVTTRIPEPKLAGKVERFTDETELRGALDQLEPYSYFATSGLVALLTRLKGLARMAQDYDLELGSANEWRSHLVHDSTGRALLVPGIAEAFRMTWEGLEKNTGTERLDGCWGYP